MLEADKSKQSIHLTEDSTSKIKTPVFFAFFERDSVGSIGYEEQMLELVLRLKTLNWSRVEKKCERRIFKLEFSY